ncbi:MAG: DNA polymerase III subunit gamma and tau [Streptosporangiales bacterium]|nr:DNA polymerase III subunit gamma and tau [Streptosporangiales bacterium]
MSLALYRKYRPATFAELRGQEQVTVPLAQALRNGRVHHAYLFSGPRGCGKTSSARILARSLNCEQGPTPEPCGVCEPCIALGPTGPGSIDVIEIDAASHGGVDDARELRERAFFAPVTSRFRIYIIDEAHMVTREGFNALLKLVEEPPPHLKFVFATTEPEKVIGTIKSRTHHYPFRLLAPGTLRGLLEEILQQEGVRYEPSALPLVVRAAAGSARDALTVLDQLVAGADEGGISYSRAVALLGYTDASLLDEVVNAFAAGDRAAVFDAVDRVIEGGHDPRRFAADLLERFRDLLVLGAVPDADSKGLLDAPPDEIERMRDQATRMGPAELARAADLFHQGLTEMRGTTSPRLLLELICARTLLPGAATDESALLARLERLERHLVGGTGGGAPDDSSPPAAASPPAKPPTAKPAPPQPPPARQPAPSTSGATSGATSGSASGAGSKASAPPAASPPAQRTPPTGKPREAAAAGQVDVAAVQGAWPDILEAVKRRRRVAWMILVGDVQVVEVDDTSLTLAFARDGDMKGFTSSGSDQILQQALADVLGVQRRVQTVAGGAASGGSPGRSGNPSGPAEPTRTDPPQSGPPSTDDPAGDPGAASPPAGPPEVDPDNDADVDPGLTGMALIQQELGGQIIDEIDNS